MFFYYFCQESVFILLVVSCSFVHFCNETNLQCIREVEFKSLHGRKIAIDASMAIYQFLIAVRSGGPNQQAMMLTNAEGETTSHIQGMFNRTVRFLTEGLKPVFVFDGKAPSMKSGELQKRREKRKKAEEAMTKAVDDDNVEEMDKQSKRLARAGRKENEDCKRVSYSVIVLSSRILYFCDPCVLFHYNKINLTAFLLSLVTQTHGRSRGFSTDGGRGRGCGTL